MSLFESPGLIDQRQGLLTMTEFTAHRPFVGRVLIPLLVRGIEYLLPDIVTSSADRLVEKLIMPYSGRVLNGHYQYKFEIIAAVGRRVLIFEFLNWLALVGFLFVLAKLLGEICGFGWKAATYIPLTLILIFPMYFDHANMAYDFPNLFLFSTGLFFLYRKNLIAYLIIFAIAMLNKETAMMLTLIFAIYCFRSFRGGNFIKCLAHKWC